MPGSQKGNFIVSQKIVKPPSFRFVFFSFGGGGGYDWVLNVKKRFKIAINHLSENPFCRKKHDFLASKMKFSDIWDQHLWDPIIWVAPSRPSNTRVQPAHRCVFVASEGMEFFSWKKSKAPSRNEWEDLWLVGGKPTNPSGIICSSNWIIFFQDLKKNKHIFELPAP